ncbi:MAG: M23 family metallopeptidase [Pseudomonadota bacterium]|nr:M23 family metallopeptidase [Pseudomonadota bacterium]
MKSLDTLDRVVAQAAARTGRFVAAHPRRLSAAVMLMLAGFGVTAFGIAPMAPDASNIPKRIVTETVTPDGIQSQLDALAEHELQLYRTDLTRSSDTADSLLKRLNVDDVEAANFLRADVTARKLLDGRGGKMVQVQTGEHGALTELVARYAPADPADASTRFTRLTLRRQAGKFVATIETAPLAAQVRMASGTVQTSLFAATDDARIPDTVATQLTDVFSTDIDFRRQLQRGDTFSVLYEALTADGEPITWGPSSAGRLIAADFVSGGRPYSAVWFKDATGKGAYYGFDGQSKKRAFLASPMEFSRVTSGFSMRLHPILNTWKQHKGVDFGAPIGTPIRAVGDGTVDFSGWQNGYGNVVEIRHSALRSTLYAHMSRIDVKRGERVAQGERIGAVGMTGWATGPHVHFEVKVNGEQQDPMLMAKSSESVTLSAAQRAQFLQQASSLKTQLEAADAQARANTYAE